MRVLIVDDEQLARDRLVRMVADFDDYEVVGEASNGVEAVRLVAEKLPEVVLLDIRMPADNSQLPMFITNECNGTPGF